MNTNESASAALEAFLVSCQAAGLSERTISWYEMVLQGALAESLSDPVSEAMALPRLRTFLAALRERHSLKRPERLMAPATVAGYARGLRRFGSWLFVEGYVSENPAARLKLPKLPKHAPKGILLDDLRAMLRVADVRERALLLFLLDTGCRAAEVCGLEVARLDLTACSALVIGKGNKERQVYLVAATCAALRAWLKQQDAKRAAGRVFSGERGPLSPVGLYQILKRLAARAGVTERWNPHAFRHAYAREYLKNGGDLASLANLLGHEDVQTTMVYSVFAASELAGLHARCSPVAALDGDSGTKNRC